LREEKKRESVSVTLFCGVGRSHQKEKKSDEKIFFAYHRKTAFFSSSLSLLFLIVDAEMYRFRGSDRHQSAEITNNRALIRVLSSFFARIGDRSRLQLASSEHIARQELEKKRYGIKETTFEFSSSRMRAYP